MRIALIGNPNCGKTTLFNLLTGTHQHVGNYCGSTVNEKEGQLIKHKHITCIDLPGIYSLSTYSNEESITTESLRNGHIDGIIQILDGSNLERNLFLTLQCVKLQIPMILALNMIDDLSNNQIKQITQTLQTTFNIDCISISAIKNRGIDVVIKSISKSIKQQHLPTIIPFSHQTKEKDIIERYAYIENLCKGLSVENKSSILSKKIDTIVLHPLLAYPCLLFVMSSIFYFTFGPYTSNLIQRFNSFLNPKQFIKFLLAIGINETLYALIVEGIFTGIHAVLSFMPVILLLFFYLSLLEDSGYMSRIAFIMDKPLKNIGLSGKSAVSLLMGFGCSVPAILSTRTLSKSQRLRTTLLIPFISCSAKIPIYTLFLYTFFPTYAFRLIILLYITSLLIGIIILILLQSFIPTQDHILIMEMPNYRFPRFTNTTLLLFEKIKEFIIKAFTIIFISSLIIWFTNNFDYQFNHVSSDSSILASIGKHFIFLFQPLGIDRWEVVVSLISGFSAKEAIISTLSVLIHSPYEVLSISLNRIFTPLSAYSFLLFTLFYTPCIASISACKQEHGIIFTLFLIQFQCIIAWIIAFIFYQTGLLII